MQLGKLLNTTEWAETRSSYGNHELSLVSLSSNQSDYSYRRHAAPLQHAHLEVTNIWQQEPVRVMAFPRYEHSNYYSREEHHNSRYGHHRHSSHSRYHHQREEEEEAPRYSSQQYYPERHLSTPGTTTALNPSLAHVADRIAGSIDTVGNCALGPRLTLKHFGLNLPQVVATEQGRILEQSGLFKEVSRSEVKPGDYAYRHWSNTVIRSHHGVDKGDSFIVSSISRHGTLIGANDHKFVVPEDGGRYKGTKFLRPTEEFYRRYGGSMNA